MARLALVSCDALMDDPDQRWSEAEAVLQGDPNPELRDRIRRRRTRIRTLSLAGFGVLCLGSLAVGAALGLHAKATGHDHPRPSPSTAQADTGLALSLLGALIVIVGVVAIVRAGEWGSRWKTPTAMLNRTQKRDLRRQATGLAPADPARLPLSRHLARRVIVSRWILLFFAGLSLSAVGSAVGSPRVWRFGYAALVVLAMGYAAFAVERDVRRARRFLERHPSDHPTTETGSGVPVD
jgi:FtsH-binding integral membrane protein